MDTIRKTKIPVQSGGKTEITPIRYLQPASSLIHRIIGCPLRTIRGERHSLEIGRELFDALDQFELDDLSVMNEIDNHYEHSDLTEESLNTRAANPQKSLEDTVFTRLQYEQLHSAVSELPEIQRRRVNLYYFGGYTFEQIALLENCTKRAVKRSVDLAVDTLRKNLKNISD